MFKNFILSCIFFFSVQAVSVLANDIVHDGEFDFLKAQHGEAWAAEDKKTDSLLAEIRDRNGGKRPNILYVLIDDVSFGQMGKPAMNDVMGIKTPRINTFAGCTRNPLVRPHGPRF